LQVPPRGGRRHWHELLRAISRCRPRGRTEPGSALRDLAGRLRRRGLVILISDLLVDPEATRLALRFLRHRGHEVLVFHILDPGERELPGAGDARFVDPETDEELPVSTADLRREYRLAVSARWRNGVTRWRRRGSITTWRERISRWRTRCAPTCTSGSDSADGFAEPPPAGPGAAVAVPIVLHLFQRQQGPRVVFPALRYLRRAEKESARQIRLRQLLLLLLAWPRCCSWRWRRRGRSCARRSAAHTRRQSSSCWTIRMSTGVVEGDRRVLDALKERALETLAAAGPDDRFWLLRAGAVGAGADAVVAHELALAVRVTEPTPAAADLGAALSRARACLPRAPMAVRRRSTCCRTCRQAASAAGRRRWEAPAIVAVVTRSCRSRRRTVPVAAVEVGGGLRR
jgi:hypothetical protein